MKIVGIGLNKTGTKTLGECLRHWQLMHKSFDAQAFELWRQKDYPALLRIVDEYESFEDWPWPLIYQEIDLAYPDSKFILTKRKSPKVWFQSLCKHADRTGPTIFRKYVYGYEMPHPYKDQHIQFYNNHLTSVRAYFRSRPESFIEVCWEDGDGWQALATFLGFATPLIPFPHANKVPD